MSYIVTVQSQLCGALPFLKWFPFALPESKTSVLSRY